MEWQVLIETNFTLFDYFNLKSYKIHTLLKYAYTSYNKAVFQIHHLVNIWLVPIILQNSHFMVLSINLSGLT